MNHSALARKSTRLEIDRLELVAKNIPFRPIGEQTKWSFITRNVAIEDVDSVEMRLDHTPQPGDLMVARIVKVSNHTRIQLRSGRRSTLFAGDQIVVAYGNRYAPDQFEAVIPNNLDACDLVAAGGIASQSISQHSALKSPTRIRPEGFCIDQNGEVMNLENYKLLTNNKRAFNIPVIAVIGTSMNSGKTTTAASVVRGLHKAGKRVAAIKSTGTGAGNDLWEYADSGATKVYDFTDAGYASTYKLSDHQISDCFLSLINTAADENEIDAIVVEVADGLLHDETLNLVSSNAFKSCVSSVLFAAGEAMGAVAGARLLKDIGVNVNAITGLLSASQLAMIEAERATGINVVNRETLSNGNYVLDLLSESSS